MKANKLVQFLMYKLDGISSTNKSMSMQDNKKCKHSSLKWLISANKTRSKMWQDKKQARYITISCDYSNL